MMKNMISPMAIVTIVISLVANSLAAQEGVVPNPTTQTPIPIFQGDLDNDGQQDVFVPSAKSRWVDFANPTQAAVRSVYFSPDGTFRLFNTHDRLFGATMEDVDASLRSQLKIPKGQGIVVEDVTPDSVAAKAGLEKSDIVLTANDVALGETEGLKKAVHGPGDNEIVVTGIRKGEKITIVFSSKLREEYKTNLGLLGPYLIGVSVVPADQVLRTHLKLPKDQGLIVTDVIAEGAAAKAGVKKHDVLLEISGKPLAKPQDLRKIVTDSKGRELIITLIREGENLTQKVIANREERAASRVELNKFFPHKIHTDGTIWNASPPAVAWPQKVWWAGNSPIPAPEQSQVDQILKQIDALRKQVVRLQKSQEAEKPQAKTVPSKK